MTNKQVENKVFLSRIVKTHHGTIHLGRGHCLVDELANKQPMHNRPVCSVFRVIAKYLAMPGVYGDSDVLVLATDDAKKRTANALTERFVIRSRNFDGDILSRDERIDSFLRMIETVFCANYPRVKLEQEILLRLNVVLAVLSQDKTFKGFGLKRELPVFFDRHNLIRRITPDELVYGVGGNPLRLTIHAMSMLRESIILDTLLSRRILPQSIRDIILLADSFAREELKSGDAISCRQCKQGKELVIPTSDGGPLWWRGKKLVYDLGEKKIPNGLTACPTRGMQSRHDLDDDDGVNVGFEIHGGPAYTDDWHGTQPGKVNTKELIVKLSSAAINSMGKEEPRPDWPQSDPRWADAAPWDLVPDKTEKGKDKKKGE